MTRAPRLTARIRGVIEAAGCASTTFADGSEEISDDGGELPPGYSIQSAEAGDVLFHSGTAVGTFAHGDSAYSDAARFAHLHGLDLAELERLFTSANDRP
jgi:hypothetical protein